MVGTGDLALVTHRLKGTPVVMRVRKINESLGYIAQETCPDYRRGCLIRVL
jgi:hypothetical protein